MRPSKWQWGYSAMWDAASMAPAGVKPDLLASAPILTSKRIFCTRPSLAACFSMAARSSQPVHGLDQVHMAHDLVHLIGLEVADKVDGLLAIGALGQLFHQLLDAVFAAAIDASLHGGPDALGVVHLTGGAEGDLGGVPAGLPGGFGHSGANGRDIVDNFLHYRTTFPSYRSRPVTMISSPGQR